MRNRIDCENPCRIPSKLTGWAFHRWPRHHHFRGCINPNCRRSNRKRIQPLLPVERRTFHWPIRSVWVHDRRWRCQIWWQWLDPSMVKSACSRRAKSYYFQLNRMPPTNCKRNHSIYSGVGEKTIEIKLPSNNGQSDEIECQRCILFDRMNDLCNIQTGPNRRQKSFPRRLLLRQNPSAKENRLNSIEKFKNVEFYSSQKSFGFSSSWFCAVEL